MFQLRIFLSWNDVGSSWWGCEPRDYARSGRWPPLTPSLGSQPHHSAPTSIHSGKIPSWNKIFCDLGYPLSKSLAGKFKVFPSWSIFMNPPKRARWYFLHCWRVHFASWKCLHKHIKYTSNGGCQLFLTRYSPPPWPWPFWPTFKPHKAKLWVATLIKLATCPPQSTRLYLLNQPFWPFCSPGQPWPTQATSFCFCSWNSWTGETRPKGKGQFQEQHSVQFSQTSYAKP